MKLRETSKVYGVLKTLILGEKLFKNFTTSQNTSILETSKIWAQLFMCVNNLKFGVQIFYQQKSNPKDSPDCEDISFHDKFCDPQEFNFLN